MTGDSPRRRVLVGFGESLAAIEAIWCLLDHGYDVMAFARAGARAGIGQDRRVRLERVPAPETDLAATAQAVARLVDRHRPDVVLPLDDVAIVVLDAAREESARDVAIAGAHGDGAVVALDKRRQLELAHDAGLPVPHTLVVDPGDVIDPTDLPAGTHWVVKPALAVETAGGRVGKAGAEVHDDPALVVAALSSRPTPSLVQPHLRGVGHGVFGFAVDGSATHWSGHRRVRMMNPSGSGSSACVAWEPPVEVLDAATRFVAAAGWNGLFMIELLVDEAGTAWFMELNGRTWGSLALAERRGLHYPAWVVSLALDPAFRPPAHEAGPSVLARHLGRELMYLAFVARGRHVLRRAVRSHGSVPADLVAYPSLTRALREIATWGSDHRLYNYRSGHSRVLVADTIATILAALPRRGRR